MNELEEYRQQIQLINNDLLHLLKKRLDVVMEIGNLKKRNNIPIRNESVEINQIKELMKMGGEIGLDTKFVEDVFKQIIAYAVKVQENIGKGI